MPQEDYAILVGISRYRDDKQFPPLDGPQNDVSRMKEWLVSHQAVPESQIVTLATEDRLLKERPAGGWPEDTDWKPTRELFADAFRKIGFDENGRPIRRQGRLYLYFSGHGFSLDDDETPSAALFSANNIGSIHTNLAGTVYAMAAKRARLFTEIVLIMDCCRDVLDDLSYNGPDFTRLEHSAAEWVKLYALYAAPKRGKSQERELRDSNGAVVGVMTDGLLRALKEAPCDVNGEVSGSVLAEVLRVHWKDWYRVSMPPPAPRVVRPDYGDITFRSPRTLVEVTFASVTRLTRGQRIRLRAETDDADWWEGVGEVQDGVLSWRDAAYPVPLDVELRGGDSDGEQFSLMLLPRRYLITVGGTQTSFVPGESNVVAI